MSDQPPPPPPHGGGGPRSGGLPPGKYDIFVIPEHSAGAGFLYLPSLQPNVNSFVAGFASALIMVVLGQSMAPAFRTWWESFQGLGNMGIVMLIIGVGFGAWSLGRTQQDGGSSFGSRPKPNASSGGPGGFTGAHPGAAPHADGPPPPPPPHGSNPGASRHQPGGPNGGPSPHGTRQHDDGYYPTGSTPPPRPEPTPPPRTDPTPPPRTEPTPPPPPQEEKPEEKPKEKPKPSPPKPESKPEPKESPKKSAWEKARDQYKGSWEKAREETRKKEEERKAKEAEQKRREETAKRLAELRAREAKERQQRELEKQKREKETKDKEERQKAQQRAKELLEKLETEKKERERELERERERERERLQKEAREREEKKKKEEEEASKTKKSGSYAFSGVGEKMSMWPNGRPAVPKHSPSPSVASKASKNPPSPEKKPPAPSARTFMSEETHSYRPYDQPKKPSRKKSVSSFASESSWAPSQTTTRTSPPPSMRGPYSTKDPDKIVISGVYLFMNQFAKTPASQLISGVGSVTDGLILRITTEGLFIDDDVRGVPQREWDVKAWTLKQVEVWCPPHCLNSSSSSSSSHTSSASSRSSPNLLHKMAQSRARNADRAGGKPLTGEEADAYLTEMLRACNDCCRRGLCERTFKDTNITSSTGQTGEWKSKGLHVLRATLRDQEAKRYLFVIDEDESWKMTVGLQRLRRGTQVRQLGVSGMSPSEARGTLEMLGWGSQ